MNKGYLFSSGTTASKVDFASFVLRIVGGGFMLINHGFDKFTNFFSDGAIEFIDPFGISATATLGLVIFAEFICAGFVLIGFLTRFSIIPLVITMIYAAFIAHGADPFVKKEPSLMYLGIYIVILLLGPGKYSIDRLIHQRRATVKNVL